MPCHTLKMQNSFYGSVQVAAAHKNTLRVDLRNFTRVFGFLSVLGMMYVRFSSLILTGQMSQMTLSPLCKSQHLIKNALNKKLNLLLIS